MTLRWPPAGVKAQPSSTKEAAKSAEACVVALLRRIDAAEQPAEEVDEPRAAAADGTPRASGAALREKLLFFWQVPPRARADATARLRLLMPQVHGLDWLPLARPTHAEAAAAATGGHHPPLLVCGGTGAGPAEADTHGFARLGLGFDLTELQRSIDQARRSEAHVAAKERQEAAVTAGLRALRLQDALDCERVSYGKGERAADGASLAGRLLPRVRELRAALDAPWEGLSLQLEVEVNAEAEAEADGGGGGGGDGARAPACELRDAADGGGELVLRGMAGVRGAVDFVLDEWRCLRCAQRRHALVEQLQRWLGCAAVVAVGLPARHACEEQVASLTALLGRIRAEAQAGAEFKERYAGAEEHAPPLLDPLPHVALAIGAAEETEAAIVAALPRGAADGKALVIQLPSAFEPERALLLLREAGRSTWTSPRNPNRSRRSRPR